MAECQSCKDARKKDSLPPMDKVCLPVGVTSEGFRRPDLPTYLCPHCDGETLVASALRHYTERQGA